MKVQHPCGFSICERIFVLLQGYFEAYCDEVGSVNSEKHLKTRHEHAVLSCVACVCYSLSGFGIGYRFYCVV